MTRETYRKMTGYFLQDEKKVRRIILANRLLTGIPGDVFSFIP